MMTQKAYAILWGMAIVGIMIAVVSIVVSTTIGDIAARGVLKQNIEMCLAANGQPILSGGRLVACVK